MLSKKDSKLNLKLINIITFLNSFRLYDGIMAIYIGKVSGSYALALFYLSVMNLSSSLLELPTGLLSDRIGRKKTIILSLFFTTLSNIMLLFIESNLILYSSAILNGLSLSLINANGEIHKPLH